MYVYAPYEARKKNCTEKLFMDEKTAVRSIQEIDTARENYQRKYCPEIKSIFDEKDIMIDSSAFGVEGTAKILVGIARKKFELD